MIHNSLDRPSRRPQRAAGDRRARLTRALRTRGYPRSILRPVHLPQVVMRLRDARVGATPERESGVDGAHAPEA
jgi:hypothetical protein